MRRFSSYVGTLVVFGLGAMIAACAASSDGGPGHGHLATGAGDDSGSATDTTGTTPGGLCAPCLTSTNCAAGSACAQVGGDTFCVPECAADGSCASGTCEIASDFSGAQVSICAPSSGPCAATTAPGSDAGTTTRPPADAGGTTAPPPADAGTPGMCGTLASPTTKAACTSCTHSTTGKTCQVNGCYGGWWCDTTTDKCHAPPTSCPGGTGGSDGGTTHPPPVDAGPPPTGSVNASGGKVSSLFFAVVGDTRPPIDNDTSGYPTAIITSIYNQVAALAPQFVVASGDYMFASPSSGESAPQLDLYLGARKAYAGTLFPAFGNHECTGQVTSNCGPGNTDGVTTNYSDFISKMLTPIGQSLPYYSIRVDSSAGAWTAKFVFVAANAWDSAQSSWLDATLAVPTTYTFVIRHEPKAATTAPGTSPSEAIMSKYPLTLAITGHTHLYAYHSPNEVVFGNGGAPLTGSSNYGFGVVRQRSDGAIVVEAHDYSTGAIDSSFTFAVTPTGSPTF